MKTKRVLYFSFEFLNPIFSGNGAAAQFQVREFLRQGHIVKVVCANSFGKQIIPNNLGTNFSFLSILIYSEKKLGANADHQSYCKGILEIQDELISFNPDLIILIDWHASYAFSIINPKIKCYKILQFFRIFGRDSDFFSSKADFELVRNFEKNLAHLVDKNLQISKDNVKWAKIHYKIDSDVLYMPINPSIKNLIDIKQDLIQKTNLSINLEDIKIITVSRISPEKRIERVIKFCNSFLNLGSLHIFGEIVDYDYYQNLKSLIKDLQMDLKIHFFTWNVDLLVKDYLSADIYIHPSSYEPFGLSIMEAAYANLLVVLDASSFIGAGEILDANQACIRIQLDEPIKARQQLLDSIANKRKIKKIRHNAHECSKKITPKSQIVKILAYLDH